MCTQSRKVVEAGDMVCYPPTGNEAGECKAGSSSSAVGCTGQHP